MQSLTFLAALSVIAQSQQTADQLPEHLRCQISGEAGCANDICVGAGRHYDKISMVIDSARKTIVINDIGGRIDGPELLDYGQRRSVYWNPRLIGLTEIHVRPERDSRDKSGAPYIVVELTDGRAVVEFMCKAD